MLIGAERTNRRAELRAAYFVSICLHLSVSIVSSFHLFRLKTA